MYEMFPWSVSLGLVALIYVLLFYELMIHCRRRTSCTETLTRDKHTVGPPKLITSTPKAGSSSLDGLWRRMRQAQKNQDYLGIHHEQITDAMAEARRRERERTSVIQLGMDM